MHRQGFLAVKWKPNQWDDSYPSRELLEKDIAFGNSYIVENDEKNLAATFAFIKGEGSDLLWDRKWGMAES